MCFWVCCTISTLHVINLCQKWRLEKPLKIQMPLKLQIKHVFVDFDTLNTNLFMFHCFDCYFRWNQRSKCKSIECPYIFSLIRATQGTVLSVCVCVCPYVIIKWFSPINYERMVGSLWYLIYTYDSSWWDLKVDARSRSRGQTSRSNIQLRKQLVKLIKYQRINRCWWYLHILLVLVQCLSWL